MLEAVYFVRNLNDKSPLGENFESYSQMGSIYKKPDELFQHIFWLLTKRKEIKFSEIISFKNN